MVVIIPAYQPDEKLNRLVLELREKTTFDLLIVNDGSDADKRPLFDSLAQYAKIIHHSANRGKGAALKTALSYIYERYPADEGVVLDVAGHVQPDEPGGA